jgi:hypothetical protein
MLRKNPFLRGTNPKFRLWAGSGRVGFGTSQVGPRAIILSSLRSSFAEPAGKEGAMHWYFYAAYFLGGAFLANAVPHFVNGVSGRSFPTPFASPPGKGLSSPVVNVLWGTLNVAIGYLLVCHVGEFHLRRIPDVLVLGAGGLLMAVMLARVFGRLSGSQ